MKYFGLSILLAAVALLAACAVKPVPQSSAAATPQQAAASHANVLRATLDNGLRVVIVRDAFAPVATQQITYFAGSNQSPAGFPGRAHAQEHMMFRGAPGLTKDQLGQIIALLGGNMNAFTDNNLTSYYFTVPSDDIDVALHVGALRMAGVADSEAQWKKERGAIEQEVARDNSNPNTVMYEKLLAHIFAGTPYAHFGVGTRSGFNKTTAKMIKQFHSKWYAPNNALLVVTGDVDPQATLAKIRKLYGAIPKKKIPAKPKLTFAPVETTTLTTRTDQPSGYVELAFRMPGIRSPDYPASIIASDVLSSQRGPISALYYEGKVLGSGFSSSAWEGAGFGTAWVSFSPGTNPATVKKALLGAIANVLKDGVNPDLITAAKRRVVLQQQLERNSIHGLANTWTWVVARAKLSSPAEWAARLRAVTPAQVNAQVKQILDLDHAVTLIAEPTPGAKAVKKKSPGGVEAFASKPSGPVILPDWAAKAFAKLPRPKPSLHPTDMTLPNGIRLIVQPLKVSQSVTLLGGVHQNRLLQTPKGEMGVFAILESLFDWGPKGMTRLQFEAAKDKLGVDLSVGSGFSLYALPQQFDAGVKLLAADLLHPALPAKAFAARKKIVARQSAERVNSPTFKFVLALGKALYPQGDPALRNATGKSVGGLTLDEVRSYYDKVYRPDETTIVVLGDITPARAKEVVQKYFDGWKASGPQPDLNLPPVPPSQPTRVFVPDTSRVQNAVDLIETVNLTNRDPAHFAVDLINSYLSGGFYGSPLTQQVREKRGLVYGIGTGASFASHRGDFYLSYGADPAKTEEARTVSLKVLKRVITTPLSAGQLHLAKSIALRQIQLGEQSVYGIGSTWLSRSDDGLPLDWSYVMARHYEQLTAPEIQQDLEKYIEPSRLATFVLGPPKQ